MQTLDVFSCIGGLGHSVHPAILSSAHAMFLSCVSQPPTVVIVFAETYPPAPKTSNPSPHALNRVSGLQTPGV